MEREPPVFRTSLEQKLENEKAKLKELLGYDNISEIVRLNYQESIDKINIELDEIRTQL